MIYITGDKHIPIDVKSMELFLENNKLTDKDYVIICGDTGFMWNQSAVFKYWLDWFDNQEFTTLFVDGNHENHFCLDSLPVKEWNGGKTHKLTNKIIHLMRGQIFNIDEIKFFTFGGGDSIDKNNRIANISWWAREMPYDDEYREGFWNLEQNNWEVDYIITHSCSSKTFYLFQHKYGMQPIYSAINQYFDVIEDKVKFKNFIFGHYHLDEKIDDKHYCLYHKFLKIENNELIWI